MATMIPIVYQPERNRATDERTGLDHSTGGAALAPFALSRKPMIEVSAVARASSRPISTPRLIRKRGYSATSVGERHAVQQRWQRRDPRRGVRRTRVVPLALRAPARAGLPLRGGRRQAGRARAQQRPARARAEPPLR